MSRTEFAYVLVRFSGFVCILVAVVATVNRVVTIIGFSTTSSALTSAAHSLSWIWLITPFLELIVGLFVLKKAAEIGQWLSGDDQT
jgi:hypothetical protein